MPKTSHPLEPAEIMAYLDGELPVNRAAAAAAHLERCAECQALAADLRAVSQGLLAWQVEASEATVPAVVVERVTPRGWQIRPWGWALASVGALALLLAIFLPRIHREAGIRTEAFSMDGQLPALRQTTENAPLSQPAPAPPPQTPGQAGKAADAIEPLAPMIARTASLTLSTREFDRVRPAIEGVLQRHHGYLANLNIAAPTGSGRSLSAVLRIPASDLTAALAELKTLGRVQAEEQSGEEVGQQYRDLEARLANARNTEKRLTELLSQRTGKLSDVLDVERELDRVREEIERMEAEVKGLAKRVDYATVNLNANEVYQEHLEPLPDSVFGRMRNAAVEGYRAMVGGVVAVVLIVIAAAPTVLLWAAILFFPVRYLWRRRRR